MLAPTSPDEAVRIHITTWTIRSLSPAVTMSRHIIQHVIRKRGKRLKTLVQSTRAAARRSAQPGVRNNSASRVPSTTAPLPAREGMEGAPASSSSPASPPPKRPAGSFPENHYSPGKLYTQFRIADGKSPLVWRKTKVFQADASPGSSLPDISSPSPARPPPNVSRRLETGDGSDTTPLRAAQTLAATDPLFRANVPASRLLQRLQASKSLPLLVRKRERAYVQRRLLDLVQPRPPPSDAHISSLRASALAQEPLPGEHELPELEKRFVKAAAARVAHAAKLGLAPGSARRGAKLAKPARAGTHAAGANGKVVTPKRKRPQGDGDEASASPFPISGGVSKTSGRTLFIPARLRGESAAEKAKRAASGSGRKPGRTGNGALRLRAGGEVRRAASRGARQSACAHSQHRLLVAASPSRARSARGTR
jgi:hypothetical protein